MRQLQRTSAVFVLQQSSGHHVGKSWHCSHRLSVLLGQELHSRQHCHHALLLLQLPPPLLQARWKSHVVHAAGVWSLTAVTEEYQRQWTGADRFLNENIIQNMSRYLHQVTHNTLTERDDENDDWLY